MSGGYGGGAAAMDVWICEARCLAFSALLYSVHTRSSSS